MDRRSRDDGKTFAPEKSISDPTTGACGCCGLRLLAADNKVIALYRGAAKQINRGMYLAWANVDLSECHTREIAPMIKGACIMSTSSIGPYSGGTLIAWETMDQVFWSVLKETDADPLSRQTVPGAASSAQKHPAIVAATDGKILVTVDRRPGLEARRDRAPLMGPFTRDMPKLLSPLKAASVKISRRGTLPPPSCTNRIS